ncbi:MAG TPA: crosslink repair DNA glycosylase YcaQ family protein, partial [Deinococcales bacterium]|nr:crosslink repair DNA glycosylase YcaQ family protein [Deinococcales bacterium]
DPVVWDRKRFEQLHGWPYRFEAYTPAQKRRFGHYALPVLWEDRAVGWVNAKLAGAELSLDLGFWEGAPKGRSFQPALRRETERLRFFLGLTD